MTPMRKMMCVLFGGLLAGCGGLEGSWNGNMLCEDGGEWPAKFQIQQNEFKETAFEGAVGGALPCVAGDGTELACNFLMSGIIYKSQPSGEQELDIDMQDCAADGGAEGSIGFGCEDPQQAKWDGGKSLQFDHQTSGNVLCRIALERE